MNIAVFIKSTTFHPNHGGLEVQNKILCEAFTQRGHAVTVYSPAGELNGIEETVNGVLYKFVNVKPKNKIFTDHILGSNVRDEWYKESFEMFLEDHKNFPYDIALSQSSAGLGIIRHKNEVGIPVISIAHGTILGELKTVLSRPKRLLSLPGMLKDFVYVLKTLLTRQKEFIHGSDLVVAVSLFVKDNIIFETGISREMVKVIYNGVEDMGVDPKIRETSKPSLIYVGRVEKDKGLFELVDCVSFLSEVLGDLRLNIVGRGSDEKALKEYAQSKGVSDRIHFFGFVKREELKEFYESSHIFILPTKRREGFPVTIPEAMMASLPIVAMDLGGVNEGVFDNETGFLIKAGNWRDFTQKIKLLLNDPKLRVRMGEGALKKAKELFSVEKMANQYLEVISEVLNSE
ncbi:hypothetical protein A2716_03740 [candidate division WWE3 bacterium RIFCSPHIGHO2_01_FULL_40_23]|uniref:Glycosyl transferase family 1 domain-containing protein n=1 Tax=candidate division WWE3 bacterium RIFCSPLOWO2_01_FULL_41_18 TaxID=1802625 RepID=A0A1F4VCK6_UNCKA|nr:MAG: hypothetical protein A2716_03740 [candidate division WWE3 bacterium RIFCSPHIGHO2_01_FULL_40_23]OGC54991.1 MAG: hypothetical protein A3A78_03350 [candidate division WWE3 bacterium RIFCSPLOWO2_01_FULL_41_18]